jgi:hypothetical protein
MRYLDVIRIEEEYQADDRYISWDDDGIFLHISLFMEEIDQILFFL